MLEKLGVARFFWKAAEKHTVNREAIADRDGIQLLCAWIDEYSNRYKFEENIPEQKEQLSEEDKQNRARCKRLSVYGITSLIYKDAKSKDLFLRSSSMLCLRSVIECAPGINPKGFSFISLARKCREKC